MVWFHEQDHFVRVISSDIEGIGCLTRDFKRQIFLKTGTQNNCSGFITYKKMKVRRKLKYRPTLDHKPCVKHNSLQRFLERLYQKFKDINAAQIGLSHSNWSN